MASVRWTGKSFELTGNILSFYPELRGFLRDRTPLELGDHAWSKWLSGRRFRHQLRTELRAPLSAPTFRAALSARLNDFGSLLGQIADECGELDVLYEDGGSDKVKLVVLPRQVVRCKFVEHIGGLARGAELQSHTDFYQALLSELAKEGERQFFNNALVPESFEKLLVVGTDADSGWLPWAPGHYYTVKKWRHFDDDVVFKFKARQEYLRTLQSVIVSEQRTLGAASVDQLADVQRKLTRSLELDDCLQEVVGDGSASLYDTAGDLSDNSDLSSG